MNIFFKLIAGVAVGFEFETDVETGEEYLFLYLGILSIGFQLTYNDTDGMAI